MRGSSVIAICEVAGMGREITVRNVVWGIRGSPGGLAPPGSAVTGQPPSPSTATSAAVSNEK